jgi:hypothetical protein
MFFKNRFLLQILVIVFFANMSFAQQDKTNELIDKLEKIQKDIQTLEKAVYSKNTALAPNKLIFIRESTPIKQTICHRWNAQSSSAPIF